MNTRLLGNIQYLIHSLKHPVALISHVNCQDAVPGGQHLGQPHQLLLLTEATGRIDQAQRHTKGALLQLLIQQHLHLGLLLRRGGAHPKTHDSTTQSTMANQHTVVNSRRMLCNMGSIIGHISII